jgi:voltage-gated potassium channel
MILGYGIIAVPTGIVSVEYSQNKKAKDAPAKDLNPHHGNTQTCQNCHSEKHQDGSHFCHNCGYSLDE